MSDDLVKGIIFDVQRYSIHDGPGIRTVVFLKGCPLRCAWCDNPEGQNPNIELLYYEHRCTWCLSCIRSCPIDAIKVVEGRLYIDREKCIVCDKCVEVCPNDALKLCGQIVSVREVLNIIKRDLKFYYDSDGGVTLSGGEPLYQPRFTLELLKACKKAYIHTAIETSGYAPQEVIRSVIPYVDLFLYDIKHIDSVIHKKFTGVPNELILRNLKLIDEYNKKIIITIPLIPSVNASEDIIKLIGKFISMLKNVIEIHLHPYHKLGVPKYKLLGRDYSLENVTYPSREEISYFKKLLEEYGFLVKVE
jgi:pyruvate formate lyase activating enzyme